MKCFLITILLVLAAGASPLAAQASRPDTLYTQVLSVSDRDSTLTAGAGLLAGVRPGTEGIVYIPIDYQGHTWHNRIARCVLDTATDSVSTMKIIAATAPVRPGYAILLYGIASPQAPALAVRPKASEKPFYRKRWFWIAGGAAAAVLIVVAAGGGGGSPSTGTVTVSGDLP